MAEDQEGTRETPQEATVPAPRRNELLRYLAKLAARRKKSRAPTDVDKPGVSLHELERREARQEAGLDPYGRDDGPSIPGSEEEERPGP